jgi:phosphoglycerate kinase
LLKKGAKIILLTHFGRPIQQEEEFSTKQLIPWFEKKGYKIDFAANLEIAYAKSLEKDPQLLLVENLRFFTGEMNQDPIFAHQVAHLGDFYIMDAFGVIHREDTSITIAPLAFTPDKRSIGFLLEREIHELNHIVSSQEKPFVLILGGNKVADKLKFAQALFDRFDAVLLCPAIALNFLKSFHTEVGRSYIDKSSLPLWQDFKQEAEERNVEILAPLDYLVAKKDIHGKQSVIKADGFGKDDYALSIGPETAELYANIIKTAQIAVYSGLMGMLEIPESLRSTKEIFNAMAAASINAIGGGDSTAAAQELGISSDQVYLSTGGGAMVAYLGNFNCPGLAAFLQ